MLPPKYLQTQRLVLRIYSQEDAESIFNAYAQDKAVAHYLSWKPHKSIKETKAFIDNCLENWALSSLYVWAIVLKSGELIGGISLRMHGSRVELGYVIAKNYWGNGYCSETVKAISDWALEQTGIYRVGAVCDVENIPSARVLEKCGFEKEGILKKWFVSPNISHFPRDCYSYSRTKP